MVVFFRPVTYVCLHHGDCYLLFNQALFIYELQLPSQVIFDLVMWLEELEVEYLGICVFISLYTGDDRLPYCPAVTPPPFATYFQEKRGGA